MVRRKLYEAQVTFQLSIAALSLDELRADFEDMCESIAGDLEDSGTDMVHSILLADVLPGSMLLQEHELPNEGRIRLVPLPEPPEADE